MTCLLVFLQGYVRRLWYEYDGPPKSSKNFRRLKFFFLGKEISCHFVTSQSINPPQPIRHIRYLSDEIDGCWDETPMNGDIGRVVTVIYGLVHSSNIISCSNNAKQKR